MNTLSQLLSRLSFRAAPDTMSEGNGREPMELTHGEHQNGNAEKGQEQQLAGNQDDSGIGKSMLAPQGVSTPLQANKGSSGSLPVVQSGGLSPINAPAGLASETGVITVSATSPTLASAMTSATRASRATRSPS